MATYVVTKPNGEIYQFDARTHEVNGPVIEFKNKFGDTVQIIPVSKIDRIEVNP